MQLRGLGLTRAGRIAIILLVVQHLGLGQVLAFAPAPETEFTLPGPASAIAALAVVVPLATFIDASRDSSAAVVGHGPPAILPDPTPRPRWLPRAPPAA